MEQRSCDCARRRQRIAGVGPGLLLAWILAGTPALAETPEAVSWYAEAVAQGERGFLITHYWSSGPRFRAETVIAGRRIVTLVNGEYYTIIDATLGTGVAIQRDARAVAADAKRGRPFGVEAQEVRAAGGEKVGEERLAGRDLEVYRLTNDAGRRTVWVSPPPSELPVRVETYSRRSGQTQKLDYVNWLSGLPLPAGFFEPDPRIELERVGYEDYVRRSRKEPVGPAPVLFGVLLHGERD
ncbi:MAG: hypothetical protein MJE66_12360 [Proteobacteria bacterium]|nr:hypothetical protein [Pseudomonadota bacterium]